MKEEFKVFIPQKELANLLDNTVEIEDFLKTIFKNKDHHRKLAFAIERENSEEGGAPTVINFELYNIQVDNNNQGSFDVFYDIHFAWGCSDFNKYPVDWKSSWTFVINVAKSSIHFEGFDYGERSTYMEF